jgi:hypothetical protein
LNGRLFQSEFDDYFKLAHFTDLIDDFQQSLSRKGFENLLWIRIQGFTTYLLAVTSQALISFLMVQSRAAPNS